MIEEENPTIIENKKLRNYISLLHAEHELVQRVAEIRQNFSNSDDSERIIEPILNRIAKINSEKLALGEELKLD